MTQLTEQLGNESLPWSGEQSQSERNRKPIAGSNIKIREKETRPNKECVSIETRKPK